jgi:hypothetical protein
VNVDEMDLVSQALDVTPWRPEAYERARTTLRGAMAESEYLQEAAPMPEVTPLRGRGSSLAGHRRRRTLGTRGKVGIGAGIGAIAAGVAAALVITSTPQPAAPTAQPSAPTGSASQASTANSPLMTLAALIKASGNGRLPGNASLVIQNQSGSGQPAGVVYALYTDKGILYSGDDKQTLMSSMTQPLNPRDSETYRYTVAARSAASGDLAAARVAMINTFPNCFGLGLSPAAQKQIWAKCDAAGAAIRKEKGDKRPQKQPTGKELQSEIDNSLWTDCYVAMSWAGGDPRIREGVLRLVSTLPEVTVTNSTVDKQPALIMTAEPPLFGDNSSKQVLTVNANTGMPISSVESGGGLATSTQTFQFARVTLANIKAGKF